MFTALNAVSEAVMGGGGDAGQPTLVEWGGPHLLPEVIPRHALWNSPPPSALPHACSSPSCG